MVFWRKKWILSKNVILENIFQKYLKTVFWCVLICENSEYFLKKPWLTAVKPQVFLFLEFEIESTLNYADFGAQVKVIGTRNAEIRSLPIRQRWITENAILQFKPGSKSFFWLFAEECPKFRENEFK